MVVLDSNESMTYYSNIWQCIKCLFMITTKNKNTFIKHLTTSLKLCIIRQMMPHGECCLAHPEGPYINSSTATWYLCSNTLLGIFTEIMLSMSSPDLPLSLSSRKKQNVCVRQSTLLEFDCINHFKTKTKSK